jgi:hypothetical protein
VIRQDGVFGCVELTSWFVSSDHPHVGYESAASSRELYVHVLARFEPRLTVDHSGQAWARIRFDP